MPEWVEIELPKQAVGREETIDLRSVKVDKVH